MKVYTSLLLVGLLVGSLSTRSYSQLSENQKKLLQTSGYGLVAATSVVVGSQWIGNMVKIAKAPNQSIPAKILALGRAGFTLFSLGYLAFKAGDKTYSLYQETKKPGLF
jgi:hypothetical protein